MGQFLFEEGKLRCESNESYFTPLLNKPEILMKKDGKQLSIQFIDRALRINKQIRKMSDQYIIYILYLLFAGTGWVISGVISGVAAWTSVFERVCSTVAL